MCGTRPRIENEIFIYLKQHAYLCTYISTSGRTTGLFMPMKREKHKISYETRVELHKKRKGCAQELEPGHKAPWENKSRKTAHFTWRRVFHLRRFTFANSRDDAPKKCRKVVKSFWMTTIGLCTWVLF